MTASGAQRARQLFRRAFDGEPTHLVRAPGRVNVIGEHTDYNDGFVFPVAIDREVWIAIAPHDAADVIAVSDAFDEPAEFGLSAWDGKVDGWGNYLQGVAWALSDQGAELDGWRGGVVSDIPVGAGLASSAALELATARAFAVVGDHEWDPVGAAKACQRAENTWVGVNSGIMDQLASSAGVDGHALLLDCRSLDLEAVPLPDGVALVVLDTSTRRELGSSGYNDRRRECEQAAAALRVDSLRDVSPEQLERRAGDLGDLLWRRARHVVTENARTTAAAEAMRDQDPRRLGALMSASHRSLRDDFEVSGDELNTIVDIAGALDGCYGARMTGGGFAGCAVALVDTGHVEQFCKDLGRRYTAQTGLQAQTHACAAVDGASSQSVG